jgi:hypothetical protein
MGWREYIARSVMELANTIANMIAWTIREIGLNYKRY